MMATEIPAAIRPYSIAVAPDSSATKLENKLFILLAPKSFSTCLTGSASAALIAPNRAADYSGRLATMLIARRMMKAYFRQFLCFDIVAGAEIVRAAQKNRAPA